MTTFLRAKWEEIVMINYEIDPKILKPYLPFGLELDMHESKCFVSLVGFKFVKSKIFGVPIPFYGSFDEVNLRFYVKRIDRKELKRGVVFISEIVPYKIVSFLANLLYKEHYSVAEMSSSILVENDIKNINYYWKATSEQQNIFASFHKELKIIEPNSLEEFIYEHYFGFTKVSETKTWEYKVNHPRWLTNEVIAYKIECDFEKMYGSDFAFLNHQKPYSVYNAQGSEVSIDWKINKLKQ